MVYVKNEVPYGLVDEFNFYGFRNIHNTRKCYYNCGGYALGTYSWYCPSDDSYKSPMYDTHYTMEERTQFAVDYMLNDFLDLRVIETLAEVTENEYAIAFRIADDDFHFMVKKGNQWYSKAGGSSKIDRVPQEIALGKVWFTDYGITYDGPLVLFAKRKYKNSSKNY